MHWSPCARGPRTLLWFGHGCTGHRVLVDHERHYGLDKDALVTVCSWTTNVIMVWAWMHWSPCARGPRTSLWFGQGCTGHRVLVDHERCYGLGMDALVTVCSWTTNVIMVWGMDARVTVCLWTTNVTMVWAWMHWSPCAREPRTSLWFGQGGTGHRVLVDHERHYGLGMDAPVTVCSWTTNVIMVWASMHRSPCARGPRTSLWFGHGCTGHRVFVDHERYYGLGHGCTGHRVLVDHECYYGLGMDALVTVCSWTTNVIMVWARMHWSPCARGPRTSLWFGHGCTGHRVFVDHERYYGLSMDALVTVCPWTTNVIMVWAWMHWSPCVRGPRTLLWFEHGCTGHRLPQVLACVGLQVVLRGEFRTAKFTQDLHD